MTLTTRNSTATLMDINEAAEHLHVSVRYMRRLVAERRIRHVKLGYFIRFEKQDVDEWVVASRREVVLASN